MLEYKLCNCEGYPLLPVAKLEKSVTLFEKIENFGNGHECIDILKFEYLYLNF